MIKIFIGFDERMPIVSSVLAHSINARASEPVSISLLSLRQLKTIFNRARNPLQSTDFSFSRFLVPYLSNFEGHSIFMDNDMIVLDDIFKLWEMRDEHLSVQCVKHTHKSDLNTKFLGERQTTYDKKNWSSLMIFNNSKCRALSPDYVNTASGLDLHQFKWLTNEDLIGEIPHRWNHLVGYDAPNSNVSIAHFTLGGPYFSESANCEFSKEWRNEFNEMLKCS
jgi:hypothetical protein